MIIHAPYLCEQAKAQLIQQVQPRPPAKPGFKPFELTCEWMAQVHGHDEQFGFSRRFCSKRGNSAWVDRPGLYEVARGVKGKERSYCRVHANGRLEWIPKKAFILAAEALELME